MVEILLTLVATAVIFILLWIGLYGKRKTQDKAVSYVCFDCSEMDCICHKVNDPPNHKP
ncbi:MAG: hypothetical protein JRD05_09850 [Deltaproteobacteria bacterium]|nr:hypothetical protein [Deltaproteobacteria bacterium]